VEGEEATCKVQYGDYKIIDLSGHINNETLDHAAQAIKDCHVSHTPTEMKKLYPLEFDASRKQEHGPSFWKCIFDAPRNRNSFRYFF